MKQPAPQLLRDHHCWFGVDSAPRDRATTAWKRSARLHQANWRESHEYPIGFQPYCGGTDAAPVGSRLALEFAEEDGANFLTPGALAAVRWRLAHPEPGEMLSEDRLSADLLSSMPMCFNLFGDLFLDPAAATHAAAALWPDAPKGRASVRFEYSPGRGDPEFLGNRSAFDAAFEINMASDGNAIVGIETKYHEHAATEKAPRDEKLARYVQVTEASGAFREGWRDRLVGTELQQIWLDHLLVLSMLQHKSDHPSERWPWGRFVLVYPAGNPSFGRATAEYRAVLRDTSTFESRTIESLLAVPDAFDEAPVASFRERYLF
ncbi:MAG TPA: hypothetical protein VIT93_01765 [Dehalococcoidia bacterium]